MGLSDVPQDAVRAWVERTCAEQGIDVAVTDPVTVRKVAALLGVVSDGPRAHARSASTRPADPHLQVSPFGLDSVDVQGPRAGSAGQDRGVVENGSDDGVLPVEVEVSPLSAECVAVADQAV